MRCAFITILMVIYDDIKHFLQHMIEKGFSSEEKQRGIYFAESLEEIKRILN